MSKYIGAVDSGTTSTRFMLIDQSGSVISHAQKEHQQIFPQEGWVEHDPMEIWTRTQEVIRAALAKVNATAKDIAAVGITNQRETTIVWDRTTGEPVYNAIVWQDLRTDQICRTISKKEDAQAITRKTGLPIATYFSGPKIRWILDNVEGAEAKAKSGELAFGTVDSWLIWQLTGGPNGGKHVTDPSNASRTLLMDLETLDWDDQLLVSIGVPRNMLPEIRPSSDPAFYGVTRTDGPIGGEVPVAGCLGDQQAATVGQTCFGPGEAKNTYGTGCFMILNTGSEIVRSANGLLTTVCYQFADQPTVYALEGSVNMAGATVQWLRDNLGLIEDAAETEAIAQSVPDTGDCYFVPAFSGLFAPYWRSDARGVLVGLTRFVNRAHIVRATLESICYQSREVLDAMVADFGSPLARLKVDGGGSTNNFLMQLQSDFLDTEVVRPVIAETTCLGAAYAAGLAVGFWADLASLKANWQTDKVWKPKMDVERRASGYAKWKKAVARTFDWIEG